MTLLNKKMINGVISRVNFGGEYNFCTRWHRTRLVQSLRTRVSTFLKNSDLNCTHTSSLPPTMSSKGISLVLIVHHNTHALPQPSVNTTQNSSLRTGSSVHPPSHLMHRSKQSSSTPLLVWRRSHGTRQPTPSPLIIRSPPGFTTPSS